MTNTTGERDETGRSGKKCDSYRIGEVVLHLLERFLGKEFYLHGKTAEQIGVLYPGRNGRAQTRIFYRKTVQRMVLLVLLTVVLFTLLMIRQTMQHRPVRALSRNENGGAARTVELEGEDDSGEHALTVIISPRAYTEEEAKRLLSEAKQSLAQTVLGENKSADHVDRDLNLTEKLPNSPVSITWTSGNYQLIDSEGRIRFEELEDGGTDVTLFATLKLEDYREEASFPVRLYRPKKSGSEAREEELQTAVRTAEAESLTEKNVDLPEKVNGKEIIWYRKRSGQPLAVLLFGFVLVGVLFMTGKIRVEKQMDHRTMQLETDYAEILNKFVLLLGAGMTIRGAWGRICGDYLCRRKEKRYAYEEMVIAENELESGVSEADAYEHFGKRCGSAQYLRFAALLNQNLRKGNKDLLSLFRLEAKDAFQRRKNDARARGEEAGTKLLVPMMLMLGVVLIIIIVPAFISMQVS